MERLVYEEFFKAFGIPGILGGLIVYFYIQARRKEQHVPYDDVNAQLIAVRGQLQEIRDKLVTVETMLRERK